MPLRRIFFRYSLKVAENKKVIVPLKKCLFIMANEKKAHFFLCETFREKWGKFVAIKLHYFKSFCIKANNILSGNCHFVHNFHSFFNQILHEKKSSSFPSSGKICNDLLMRILNIQPLANRPRQNKPQFISPAPVLFIAK